MGNIIPFLSAEEYEKFGAVITGLAGGLSFLKEISDIYENCYIGYKDREKEATASNDATHKDAGKTEMTDSAQLEEAKKKKNPYSEAKDNFKYSWCACGMHIFWLVILLAVSFVYFLESELFFYEKAVGVSSTTINVYGAARANNSHTGKLTVWDADDVVTPAHATDQFFVMTKLIKTVTQNRSLCSDEPSSLKQKCTSDDDCEFLKLVNYSDGYANGTCDMARGTCYVNAWCPVDTDLDDEVEEVLDGTGNFIVHINTSVIFQFKDNGLKGPHFNPYDVCLNKGDEETKRCPFFKVEDIVKKALENRENNQHTFQEIVAYGGVFSIVIDWNCTYEDSKNILDCDQDNKSCKCDRSYSFQFLHGQRGYSYSDVDYQNKNSRHFRKEVGMLFFIEVHAKGKARSHKNLLLKMVTAFVALKSVGTVQSIVLWAVALYRTYSCTAKTSDSKA